MSSELVISIKKLDEQAEIPVYSREGDAALDLKALCDLEIAPGERKMVSTGIALAIPEGYCGLVLPRSGNAIKNGITLPNAPGLLDSNYRGEVLVPLINHDKEKTFVIHKGDRFAQLLIIECPKVSLTEVDELDETNRGEAGFGSSGC